MTFSELYFYTGFESNISLILSSIFGVGRSSVLVTRRNEKANMTATMMFGWFCVSLLYVFSYLPYGRFFNSIGGNNAALLAYMYIYFYLSGGFLRSSVYKFSFIM
jgi:hypothetical protein